MKSFIVPVATIIGLIIFFIIVAPRNSVALIEAKLKPQAKPTETKPVVETSPLRYPLVETTVEPQTSDSDKPEEKLLPAALSVVTAEEAKKLNEFALFLATVKTTVVEGEIIERSELPDPQTSDYPECRFTVHFKGIEIKSGEPCPKELILIVEGFNNYHILPTNEIKKGDIVLCTIAPFDLLPTDFQSTQTADDLELFQLDSYYLLDIKKIKRYTGNEWMPISGIYFLEKLPNYTSLFHRHINPPIPEYIKTDQERSIRKDLDLMSSLLDGYDKEKMRETNKLFAEVWAKEKEKDPADYNRVRNTVWRNIDNTFWALPMEYTLLSESSTMSQEMINFFSALKDACEENGVQMIVSLVPDYYVISSRVINRQFQNIPDFQTLTYIKQFLENNIEAIYVSDSIIKNYNKFPFSFFYPSNNHPGDTVQDCIANILSEKLKRYDISKDLSPDLFDVKLDNTRTYSVGGPFLFPQRCDIGTYKEGTVYECLHFYYDSAPLTNNKKSEIMIIGNSFIKSPLNSSPDLSLPSFLMYKTHSSVNWYLTSGINAPFSSIPIRILQSPDSFLKGKKVLIFQVGTSHLTEADQTETMLNIAELDRERVLLNNKKIRGQTQLHSSKSSIVISGLAASEIWGPLSNTKMSVLKIDETGDLSYNINLMDAGIDVVDSKPITCVIPCLCAHNTMCKMIINKEDKMVRSPNDARNSRFFNLIYELPAGTKEITLNISPDPITVGTA